MDAKEGNKVREFNVVEAELHTELKDGRTFVLRLGMSYQVADNAEPHRSSTAIGAKLFVVD